MNQLLLRNMTLDELLRFVDRSHPEVRALAERLEAMLNGRREQVPARQQELPLEVTCNAD